MAKRYDNLYGEIANFTALKAAARRAIRGKRKKPGASAFCANLEPEILRLERELRAQTYRPGRYVEIEVRDPKHRIVSAAPFRDRVVHHALCAVIEAIFEAGFIANSFANRSGKGTHKAIEAYERYRDTHAHVLRCDIYRYFPAIDHAILKAEYRRRIACERTLWLLDRIVDGSNRQEPVNLYFPGDDLFGPFARRRGLPLGNLTSQFFANLYLDRFDHFATEVLRAPYVRYVDDFALFHDDPAVLAEWRERIAAYLTGRRLKLHPKKTYVQPTVWAADFLGLTLEPDGFRRLPAASVRRFRNRMRGMQHGWQTGDAAARQKIGCRVLSWVAHAAHANSWRLRQAIFERSWFDPAIPLKPERPPAGGCFAAVPGTTIHTTSAPPTATGTARTTATTIAASVWPVHFPPELGDHGPARRASKCPGPFMMRSPGT